jgi:putative transposase
MKIIPNQLYHIYNQGNNREQIFLNRNNYLHFLGKFKELVLPYCQPIAYCLMPNHFHFLINSTEESALNIRLGNIESCRLANGFRLLCSGYANDYNKKYDRSGSLFRQKTQAKNVEQNSDYPFICFQYIHQNPIAAGLCKKMEDWEFSSFREYCGFIDSLFIKTSLACELIGVSKETFYEDSYKVIDKDKIKNIF